MCLSIFFPVRDAGDRFPSAWGSGGNSKLSATRNGTRVALVDLPFDSQRIHCSVVDAAGR